MILRRAARAVVVTPREEVLLIQARVPDTGRVVWVTPGGGLEPGEDAPAAARRELGEETGYLGPADLQGPIWLRRHKFVYLGNWYDQRESFFLLRCARFDPDNSANPAQPERDSFMNFRWWDVGDIRSSDANFVPGRMGQLLTNVLENGVPHQPVEIGR